MRPLLHFTPGSGWINDPHGIIVRNGIYEVFYQHVPYQTTWAADCHWGHATGRDLLTLEEQPIAIAPGDGDDGIWTGSVVEDNSGAHAFYTAISTPDFSIGRVRVAHPDDSTWLTWSKSGVVVEAPSELDLLAFRDPFVRKSGDHWRMFIGAADRNGNAMAITYVSDDLAAWDYDGVALSRNTENREPVWMGALWECPQVFDLNDKSVMLTSVWNADVLHYAAYAIGTFGEGRFDAESWARLTWGDSYYAPSFFTDSFERPSVIFWLRGIKGAGWQGALSVPYLLNIVDGRLAAVPHPDVTSRRVEMDSENAIPGLAADIKWTASEGELKVSSGLQDLITLSRRGPEILANTHATSETFPASEAVRIIVDGPIVEISSSAGLYAVPVAPGGSTLELSASHGDVEVYALK